MWHVRARARALCCVRIAGGQKGGHGAYQPGAPAPPPSYNQQGYTAQPAQPYQYTAQPAYVAQAAPPQGAGYLQVGAHSGPAPPQYAPYVAQAAPRQGGPPAVPCSKLLLRLACRDLKKMDVMSESDPMVIVAMKSSATGNRFMEIGRTECLKNTKVLLMANVPLAPRAL